MANQFVIFVMLTFLGLSARADIPFSCEVKDPKECVSKVREFYEVLGYAHTSQGYHVIKNALSICQIDLSRKAIKDIETACFFDQNSSLLRCKFPSKVCTHLSESVPNSGTRLCNDPNPNNVAIYTTEPGRRSRDGTIGEEAEKPLFCVEQKFIPKAHQESRPGSAVIKTANCPDSAPPPCGPNSKLSSTVDGKGCKKQVCVESTSGGARQQ